jgi:hypothetical protein
MSAAVKKEKALKIKKITFKCKLCVKEKPLEEMVVLSGYFPPVISCRDCEKNLG